MPFTPDPEKKRPSSGFVPDPAPVTLPPTFGSDAFKAAVHSQMLGIDPGTSYQSRDEIDKQLRSQCGDYDAPLDDTILNDIKTGLQGSVFGLMYRNKMPDEVRNSGMIDKVVTGLTGFLADLPVGLAGSVLGATAGAVAGSEVPVVGNVTVGAVGAGAGFFAIPAALRQVLVDGIQHGDVKGFGDLMHRAADVAWAATKGAVTGAATVAAEGVPVGSLIAKSGVASTAVKGMYQVAAMTTAGDVLDGHLPTASEFTTNAALMVPLNLVLHGVGMKEADAKQASMDVYVKDGTTPAETTERLNAQPPVKPDPSPGLRPAISMGDLYVDAEEGETHSDLSERVLAKKPVTMEQLEADPAKADDVLENPKIHDQDVIDRAWQLKKEAIEAGDVSVEQGGGIEPVPPEPTVRDHLANFLERVGTRMAREQYGQDILDKMDEAGESPNAISKQFWENTYFDMPAEAQQVMQKQLKALTGMEPGDTIMVKADGTSVEAKDWADIAENLVGDKVEGLEGGERGYVSMMRDAIDRFGENAKPESEQTSGSPRAQLPAPKPTSIDDLYNRSEMKSGRGFVTPDGKFLSRSEAKGWMKENEPDVHEMWADGVTGDNSAELHTEDYAAARNRVQARSLAEGDATIANVAPEPRSRLAAAREGLNKIKAGLASKGYGKEVLRTLFVGQRDTRIAATTQLRDSIQKIIPDYRDQEALSILRDYKGTPDKLAADLERIWESGSDREKALIPSIERAMNPTPELMKADGMLTDYYTGALDEGRQLGFMESKIDPSHYSPHILTRILEGEKPSGTGKAAMTQNTPFSQERSYPTILDALKTGKIDAQTVNALDALSVYGDRHATVVATKLLATELKNTELGKYGTRDNHPEGWVEMAPGQGAFRQTIPITNPETGEPDLFSRSLYVPKDVADALKPMFEQGIKGTMLSPLLKAQSYVKMLELGLSFFHMKALSITALNNMGLADFTRSLASDLKSPEFAESERGWAADGLTTAKTSTPYEAYKGMNKSSIPTGLDKLSNIPVIKQVDALFKFTTHETFEVIQRKFKVEDASLKGAKWMANHPDATNEEYFAARRSIAKEVNAAYGGLNWDVLGTGKTVRDVSRLFLLAPDWTFSNVLNAKYSFEGGPAGSAARMFWAKSFATGFAMTAAASIAIGGKYDPTDVKHIDQVYLGTDKEGKEMYANWFFAGAPKDAMTLGKRAVSDAPIASSAEFIVSKASPMLGMLGGLNSNKQATGAPIYNRTDDTATQTYDQAKYVAGRVIPITGVSAAKTVADALTDPDHEYSYTDLLNLAADALGSPTQHQGSAVTSSSGNRNQRPAGRSRFSIRGKR
jgi:hypothetical protein